MCVARCGLSLENASLLLVLGLANGLFQLQLVEPKLGYARFPTFVTIQACAYQQQLFPRFANTIFVYTVLRNCWRKAAA